MLVVVVALGGLQLYLLFLFSMEGEEESEGFNAGLPSPKWLVPWFGVA